MDNFIYTGKETFEIIKKIIEKSQKVKMEVPLFLKLLNNGKHIIISSISIFYTHENFEGYIRIYPSSIKEYTKEYTFAHTHPTENGVICRKKVGDIIICVKSYPDIKLSEILNSKTAVLYKYKNSLKIDIIEKNGSIRTYTISTDPQCSCKDLLMPLLED